MIVVALSFAVKPANVCGQICTEDFCEIPSPVESVERETRPLAVAHGYMDAVAFLDFLEKGLSSKGKDAEEGGIDRQKANRKHIGVGWRFILAFFAGLLLNLTPCVLPLLPIQVAVLGMGNVANDRMSGALRGTVYGLSMALTYGVLGFAVARSGAIVGSLQSTRGFNAAIAVLFILLAMAVLGVFRLDMSSRRKSISGAVSWLGLILAGSAAAVLAGACVAPAVLGTMLYAADEVAAGNTIAAALPFVLGLGLAAPWPVAGAGLAVLPKPGRWMRFVNWGFAAIAFAFAIHYANIAMSSRVERHSPGVFDAKTFPAMYEDAIETGRPVVIDFFASWCGSCERMEKTTFRNSKVQAALENCEFLRVQLEDPLADDAVSILSRFDIRGFPAIVVVGTP